jgi:hypothetical protein
MDPDPEHWGKHHLGSPVSSSVVLFEKNFFFGGGGWRGEGFVVCDYGLANASYVSCEGGRGNFPQWLPCAEHAHAC